MFSLVPFSRRNSITRKDDWFNLDKIFDSFFRDPFFSRVSAITAPIRADVRETEKEYIVEAELPGVKKEDIVIDINDDVLTLGVDINEEKNEEDNGYIYRERQSGSFRRSFYVQNIKHEGVKASYKDGLLVITLPKVNPGKTAKRIKID